MFAIVALVLFIVGIVVLGTVHVWSFWLLAGLAALSLHFVWDIALPVFRRRV